MSATPRPTVCVVLSSICYQEHPCDFDSHPPPTHVTPPALHSICVWSLEVGAASHLCGFSLGCTYGVVYVSSSPNLCFLTSKLLSVFFHALLSADGVGRGVCP